MVSFSICTPKRGSARRRPREGRQVSGKCRARAARRWSERRQAAALWGRRPYRRLADQSISPARKPSLARPAIFGIGIAVVDGPQHIGQEPACDATDRWECLSLPEPGSWLPSKKEHMLVEEIGQASHRRGSLRRRIHLCLAISSLTPPTANSRQPPKSGPCRPAAVARPVGRRDALLTLYNRNSGLDASTFQDSIGTCHASRQRFFAISTVSNQ